MLTAPSMINLQSNPQIAVSQPLIVNQSIDLTPRLTLPSLKVICTLVLGLWLREDMQPRKVRHCSQVASENLVWLTRVHQPRFGEESGF